MAVNGCCISVCACLYFVLVIVVLVDDNNNDAAAGTEMKSFAGRHLKPQVQSALKRDGKTLFACGRRWQHGAPVSSRQTCHLRLGMDCEQTSK